MQVRKANTTPVSLHYLEKDFYSHSPDAPSSHYLDEKLIAAFEIINSYLGIVLTPSSTFRTYANNLAIGGSSGSQHLTGHAADGDMSDDKLLIYNAQIESRGPLYQQLRAAGINGFGLYDNFFHIDTREGESFWDNRAETGPNSITQAIASSYYNNEDGIKDWKRTMWIILILFFIIALTILIIKFL